MTEVSRQPSACRRHHGPVLVMHRCLRATYKHSKIIKSSHTLSSRTTLKPILRRTIVQIPSSLQHTNEATPRWAAYASCASTIPKPASTAFAVPCTSGTSHSARRIWLHACMDLGSVYDTMALASTLHSAGSAGSPRWAFKESRVYMAAA